MPSVAPKHFILKNKKGIVLLYIEIQPSVVEELKHCIQSQLKIFYFDFAQNNLEVEASSGRSGKSRGEAVRQQGTEGMTLE